MKAQTYLTNSMPTLKREALAAQDIDVLRQIRTYEDRLRKEQIYYIRESETIIRDEHGNEIDPKVLPFPQNETSLHFREIIIGALYSLMKDKPGDLMSDIRLVGSQGKEWSVMILEVPDKTDFPIRGGFPWWVITCWEYVKSGEYVRPHWRSHYRLDGQPKSRIYRYEINGNRIISNQPPRNGSPYTTTIE